MVTDEIKFDAECWPKSLTAGCVASLSTRRCHRSCQAVPRSTRLCPSAWAVIHSREPTAGLRTDGLCNVRRGNGTRKPKVEPLTTARSW